ncbi:hypothetical protein BC831DRAFT_481345 [Entophlyctis helioformis]|nr:hypothetical protein BC831DRAFT_481345 [Entophlyctis helioformis]
MNDAAMRGHLHVVQWLHANTTAGCTTDAMDWAAGRGDLRMLEWLRANTTAGCTLDAVANAIDSSRLDAIRWLHQHYTHLFELYFVAEVAASGDLAVLQCLLECGCTATLDAIQEASDDKTLAVLLNSLTLVDAQELLQVAMDADSEQAVEQLTRVVSQLTVASADNE